MSDMKLKFVKLQVALPTLVAALIGLAIAPAQIIAPAQASDLPSQIMAPGNQEIGYDSGELGYAALVERDYQRAEAQILVHENNAQNHQSIDDGAKLLNLAHAYVHQGRYEEARAAYQAAARARSIDIILSDGRVTTSRKAARLALSDLRRPL